MCVRHAESMKQWKIPQETLGPVRCIELEITWNGLFMITWACGQWTPVQVQIIINKSSQVIFKSTHEFKFKWAEEKRMQNKGPEVCSPPLALAKRGIILETNTQQQQPLPQYCAEHKTCRRIFLYLFLCN